MLKLHSMVQQKEPILGEIRGITQHEGDVIAYDQLTQDGVKIVTEGFKEVRVDFETKIEDVPTLTGTVLDSKLSSIAEEIARNLSGNLRATLDTTTREAGTSFDAGGAPLSKDHYLQVMERVEINFDPKTGRPELVVWAGQEMIEGKRLSNTPVPGRRSVLKFPDERRTEGFITQATYPSGSSAVGGRVCAQRDAAERVLPESRFELQHAGSPSEEMALEEAT
jgi:hypothetical protein